MATMAVVAAEEAVAVVETDFSTMGLILITTCYIFTQNQ